MFHILHIKTAQKHGMVRFEVFSLLVYLMSSRTSRTSVTVSPFKNLSKFLTAPSAALAIVS